MRPVQKGAWPLKGNSLIKTCNFNDWTRAIPHLKLATGSYCHFCEMRVTNALAIEHIQPKEHFPLLENDWDNFLLICNYCNSEKLDTIPIHDYRANYFWPHLNNTLLAFDCDLTTGRIVVKASLTNPLHVTRAQRLINLYGLAKHQNASGKSDPRWLERVEAMLFAINRKVEYQTGVNTSIPAIIDLAKTKGFFSVWLKIFDDIPTVRTALIQCLDFKIPLNECFDLALLPIQRSATDL